MTFEGNKHVNKFIPVKRVEMFHTNTSVAKISVRRAG